MKRAGIDGTAALFSDCRISASVSDKLGGRRGLYFSGVPAKTTVGSGHAPKAFRTALAPQNVACTLLDVWYDLEESGVLPQTFCLYGSL